MTERPTHRMLTSRSEFHDALREAFATAAEQGCRELFVSDPDFADWPLGETAVVEHLSAWAMAHRKLVVLAQGYDEIVRRHPRWVAFRRQWAHVVECRAIESLEARTLPSMLIAPGLVTVRLFDAVHYRASISCERADEVRARENLDVLLQQSEEAFPATTLGL